jgi:hypothetical protein
VAKCIGRRYARCADCCVAFEISGKNLTINEKQLVVEIRLQRTYVQPIVVQINEIGIDIGCP